MGQLCRTLHLACWLRCRTCAVHDVTVVNGDDCMTGKCCISVSAARPPALCSTTRLSHRVLQLAHAVKSGSRDILVENLTCTHSHGITIGSIWYDDVTNVTCVLQQLPDCPPTPRPIDGRGNLIRMPDCNECCRYRNCHLHKLKAGPRIKGRRQGNATISDIHFENIVMDGVQTGIQVDMTYETPGSTVQNIGCTARGVTFTNVTGTVEAAGEIQCLPSRPCELFSMEGVAETVQGLHKSWNCAAVHVAAPSGEIKPALQAACKTDDTSPVVAL